MSRVMLGIAIVGVLAAMMLHSTLFPGQALPVFGELVPLFGGLAHSGIWFFLIGILGGFALVFATLLGEAAND